MKENSKTKPLENPTAIPPHVVERKKKKKDGSQISRTERQTCRTLPLSRGKEVERDRQKQTIVVTGEKHSPTPL